MALNAENPCAGVAGVSEMVQLGGSNSPESKSPLVDLQVRQLTRRCAISFAMAAIVAPLAFGERA
jgi:hypothetical protein